MANSVLRDRATIRRYALGAPMIDADTAITIAGIVIPSSDPRFLSALGVHVLSALVAIPAGATAMLSPKRRGRHTRGGTLYYRSLLVVFGSMAILSAMRWNADYHLFITGCLSLFAAFIARRAIRGDSLHRVRVHVTGMGASYILLLVAFYVDNGKSLPIWKHLPAITYWVLPLGIGGSLTARVLVRHPLVKAERARRVSA